MPDQDEETQEPSFAELFEATPFAPGQDLRPGDSVEGVVANISKESVFVDLGGKSEGIADTAEFLDEQGNLTVAVGDRTELKVTSVSDGIFLSKRLKVRGAEALEMLQDARQSGIPVEGRVTGVNKGGLEIDLSGHRAFCPVSQIDLGFCENPAEHMGARYSFRILEIRERGKNIIVSRRALLEEEREKQARETLELLKPGVEREGKVTRLTNFGAFVDIGGVDGMLHVSEIAHYRVTHPSEVLQVGQTVKVVVLDFEKATSEARPRISLSMKALEPSPWEKGFGFRDGEVVHGKVSRLADFGAFVEIAPGVEGLVHVSEITYEKIRHPGKFLKVGQEVDVRVLEIDAGRRRISLSIKEASGRQAEGPEGAEPRAPEVKLQAGAVLTGIVEKIKPYGLFLRLPQAGPGVRGLLPTEEMGLPGKPDVRRKYPEGTSLQVQVLEIDGQGRIRLSLKAIEDQKERETYRQFTGGKGKSAGMGTLGDLFKDLMLPPKKS